MTCADCFRRGDRGRHVPIDEYAGQRGTRWLCLGDLASRRLRGETWERVA